MISDYTPDIANIMKLFFNSCSHDSLKDGNYCINCNKFIKEKELEDINELKKSLYDDVRVITGGLLLGKIIRFLCTYGEIYMVRDTGSWHEFCWSYKNKDGNLCRYSAILGHSFAFKICWMAEMALRVLVSDGYTITELTEELNEH